MKKKIHSQLNSLEQIKVENLLEAFGSSQHVAGPTHDLGYTINLMMTKGVHTLYATTLDICPTFVRLLHLFFFLNKF